MKLTSNIIIFLSTLSSALVLAHKPHDPNLSKYAHVRCPNSITGTLPTPTYGSDGGYTVCNELFIKASIRKVYDAFIDFQRYPAWNTFIVKVDLPPGVQTPTDVYAGMPMTFTAFDVLPSQNFTGPLKVTYLSAPAPAKKRGYPIYALAAWRSTASATNGFDVERVTVITDAGQGWTRYVSYETYYGDDDGLRSVYALRPAVNRGFLKSGLDLNGYVESS
ncbi:MAG: hypothetical protein M1831_001305 [Alyxoria varia]|nr:MAG: hypothetical protein M1831_001305 [Alyxoria varia]